MEAIKSDSGIDRETLKAYSYTTLKDRDYKWSS